MNSEVHLFEVFVLSRTDCVELRNKAYVCFHLPFNLASTRHVEGINATLL